MLAFLPIPLRITLIVIAYSLLTFLLPLPILLMGIFYGLIPAKKFRVYCDKMMQAVGKCWGDASELFLALFTKIEWHIRGIENLNPQKSYLIIANHQSWADIIVIQKAFNRKTPLSRYFIKKQLSHVPIIGWCCRLLHFPVMHRYSKEILAKYPELKGKDIETTRQSCAHFKDVPVAIINFAEGTRFTPAKRLQLQSPYQYLLAPRAGGIAFVLAALGEYFDAILDTTIIYDHSSPTLLDFFTGKVKKVIVDVKTLPARPELRGDYQNDPIFKSSFQHWLNQLWTEKDLLLKQALDKP